MLKLFKMPSRCIICKELICGGLISFGFTKSLSKEMTNRWKAAAGKSSNWNPKQHERICSNHFEEKYFVKDLKSLNNGMTRLHSNAVPTLALSRTYSPIPRTVFKKSKFRTLSS